ncbi:amino acid ABC transporter ATP-binding protein [Nesterenkonia lutea]|uniref:Polar amino acid transport system ATP-binding protein n=2 Tax=Nesterenkonia lutea TaxID=272919 RepID=A0ABR9JIC9_9MICC|nr:amino acid ABC transporter ATP-binding protein [Nesterenkonia lutea]MBE1525538.1 polar amino acid transport system ATP-binding protein [Nesterenkonia lutea]
MTMSEMTSAPITPIADGSNMSLDSAAATAAIFLEDIHMRFGNVHALSGADLTIQPREVVALIGPSGSGKSTLLRTVNLLAPLTSGRVTIGGTTLSDVPEGGKQQIKMTEKEINKHRARVGMVFQHFNLFPHLTAIQNVVLGPTTVQQTPPAEAKERGAVLLEKFGLGDKLDVSPRHLSGGQKQRVAIARALAMKPEVMLFDEVTAALDPEMVGEVITIMRQLATEDLTMVVATHEMDFALEVADRVVFMDEGRIVETGPARDVLLHPQQARTQAFLTRLNRR